jgi:hypothetical protein
VTQSAPSSEGWRPDPFGRFESRFWNGSSWTPYVKTGSDHALDDPIEGPDRGRKSGPAILEEKVLVVEQHVDENRRLDAYEVRGAAGQVLASVRRNDGDPKRLDIVDDTGAAFLTLQIVASGRKRIVSVRSPEGGELGRLIQNHLPGVHWFAMESAAGGTVGNIRALTWAGWDIRVEDDQSRTVALLSKTWDGLDRSLFPAPDNFVVRISRERPDPFRILMFGAAIGMDTALKQDSRGFN